MKYLRCGLLVLAVGLLGSVSLERPLGAAELERISPECVGEEPYAALEACPAGSATDFRRGRSRPAAAFKTAPPPRESKSRQDALSQKNAPEEMAAGHRDLRTTRLAARGRQLLITEISGLERLYKRTPAQSPDRQQLVRRLAEAYVELESAATRDAIKSSIDADDAKKARQRAPYDQARREEAAARKISQRARENAIRYYVRMKEDYPNYSKIDEVLYYLAFEYEQKQDLENARQVYLELIEKAPQSSYIPNAYLAFGELFFADAMGDPSKWALAAQAYKEVVKYKPPQNKVYGYAQYKLGYVYWNSGDYPRAIQQFKRVIEYGDDFSELPNAKLLQKSARNDLIPVYAVAGDPRKAYRFFRPLSGDERGSETETFALLRKLATSYYDTGHYSEAVTLYRNLMARDRGDQLCKYQAAISQAVQTMKATDKVAIRRELDAMVKLYDRFSKAEHSEEVQLACANDTAELLAETAMSWHLEAVGSGGTRGTNDPQAMELASYLYQRVVDTFTPEQFETFKFPRIMKDDWPNIYKIRFNMADLLYTQQRWEDCGPAFDAVVEANPTGEEAPEAAFAAVLCYEKMYSALHSEAAQRQGRGLGPTRGDVEGDEKRRGLGRLAPKALTPAQEGMIGAFNRYVCYVKPGEKDAKAQEEYVDIKYHRARVYFEAQNWDKAALAFRDIALNHSGDDDAIFAAQLYLEALNVVGTRSEVPRPVCIETMADDMPRFIELFCDGKNYAKNQENCDMFSRIQCDIRRLAAEKTVELVDLGQAPGRELELLKKAGDAYIEIWREYGEGPMSRGESAKCGAMDEVLHNAAQAYQAGRLLAKSIAVRRILLSSRYGMQDSPLAQEAIYKIGSNYQAIAVYDAAADYFMRYAEGTKFRGEFASQALNDAIVLNLGIGNEERAIEAAGAFNRNFGRRKPKEAAQIAFAIAAHYAENEAWREVASRLSSAMRMIDRQASLDIKLQAHALLGHAREQQKAGSGDREYAKVVAAWKRPEKATAAILSMEEPQASKERRLGKAVTAVGEALFHFAEKKRREAEALKFPVYKGRGNMKAVARHVNTKVAKWIKRKRPRIEAAQKEYQKVVDIQPQAPPQWVIAAGSRVGGLWGKFVADFRAAPIPNSIKRDVVLSTAYYAGLDGASEPFKLRAKGAYGLCLNYSVNFQYFDSYSRSCEKWLADEYKSEFHLVDEFRGDPNRVNRILAERPQPLGLGGQPVLRAAPPVPAPKPAEAAGVEQPVASGVAGAGAVAHQ